MLKVTVTYTLDSSVRQDDVRIRVHPAFHPSFHWAPHLTPTDNHVIDQHVFRNPAMIMQSGDTVLVMALSPENLFRSDNYHMYADMDAKDSEMSVGISRTEVTDHVLYERKPGMIVPEGKLSFEFYLMENILLHTKQIVLIQNTRHIRLVNKIYLFVLN